MVSGGSESPAATESATAGSLTVVLVVSLHVVEVASKTGVFDACATMCNEVTWTGEVTVHERGHELLNCIGNRFSLLSFMSSLAL